MDHQVKLHGHRIELGEITAAIDSIDGVRESAVFLRRNRTGEDCLVAYVSVGIATRNWEKTTRPPRGFGGSFASVFLPTWFRESSFLIRSLET